MKKRATETHCANGHLWTPETLRIDPKRGWRVCKECNKLASRRYYQIRKQDHAFEQEEHTAHFQKIKAMSYNELLAYCDKRLTQLASAILDTLLRESDRDE